MEIRVRETNLPGVGVRYDVDADGGPHLFVVVRRDGRRTLGLTGEGDEPAWQLALEQGQAVTVAALLLGARFTLDTTADAQVASDEVVVDSVEVREGSPAVGLTKREMSLPDDEAVLLAVISDSTPQLVEDEANHRCLPGDRVVVAARGSRIDEVLAYLQGPPVMADS
jgi:TrkA domain protein